MSWKKSKLYSPPLSDRVTLRPPSPSGLSPFDHYRHKTVPAQRANPFEYNCRKLGITEETLKESLNDDIDSLLMEIEEVRMTPEEQVVSSTQENFPPSAATTPTERVMSKDECFTLLCRKELNTGSLLGMYLWTADLGRARYWNFEMTWDQESIELLDAYD